jgi:hypothetical protein
MKNSRLGRQVERHAKYAKEREAQSEFWRKWHEPRQRREMLQRLATMLSEVCSGEPE